MNAAVVELFDGVDDLIRRVADTENPEIRKVRAKGARRTGGGQERMRGEAIPATEAARIAEPAQMPESAIEAAEDVQ